MQKLRQILLFLKRGYSERSIVKQTGISRQTVHQYARLFLEAGSDYNTLLTLSDHQLNSVIEGNKPEKEQVRDTRKSQFLDQIDYFVLELKRVGVTRQLLWQEYLEAHPSGFQYSRFCELLDIEMGRRKPSMHFSHNPAELMEIDFAGSKLHYVDKKSGEIIECPVLIGVLPFSGYAYVEALDNASLPQVIKGLNNMLDYLGGVPLNAISDNMRQWVSKSCRYEPTFPQMLEQWSIHNHIGLLATRPGFPKDYV